MAWYTIEHICGHTSERQINGTNTRGERTRKAAWYGEKSCPDCLAKERSVASQAAAEVAQEMGWPDLTGSHGQIAWAQRLRLEALDELDRLCRDAGVAEDQHAWARGVLIAQTSASQWIGYRGGNPRGDRLQNILNTTDHAPVARVVRDWATDPDRSMVDAFCADVEQRQR